MSTLIDSVVSQMRRTNFVCGCAAFLLCVSFDSFGRPAETTKVFLEPHSGGPYEVIDRDNSGAENVLLDGSASIPAEAISHYQWKCQCAVHGGKNIAWTKRATVNVEFSQGTHAVTLRVKGKEGSWSEMSDPVSVVVMPPSDAKKTQTKRVKKANPNGFNVLFIAVDDFRTELGAYNENLVVKTPHLDEFAGKSMLFERAYCQQSVCSASRSSLMAGVRPETTGVQKIKDRLRAKMPNAYTLPRLFRDNGYTARSLGKIYHKYNEDNAESWSEPAWKSNRKLHQDTQSVEKGGKMPATERGDDKGITDESYQDGDAKEMAIKLLTNYKATGEHFFLAVGFNKPHLPFCAPAKYWDLYERNKIYNAAYTDWPKGMPHYAQTDWTELGSYWDTAPYVHDKKKNPNPPAMPMVKAKELIHGYYACVSYVDAMIGQLLDAVDRLGLRENTVIVLWGDHGWKLYDYGAWSKQTNLEIDNRVPLLIDVPGLKAGRTDALVELVDLYPTLAELCGLTPPENYLEGTSMVPVLKNAKIAWKPAAFSQYHRGIQDGKWERRGMGYSIRSGEWRYTEWWLANGKLKDRELYKHTGKDDLVSGVNVVEKHPDVVKKLSKLLNRTQEGEIYPGEGWKDIQAEFE